MERSEIVLASLAAGGSGAVFDPVQVQKLLFLIDREIPKLLRGPHFDFKPYLYGPFDKAVYEDLLQLAKRHEVRIDQRMKYRRYSLSRTGYSRGCNVLGIFPKSASSYMEDASTWVRSVTFMQLLSAIYRRYPDMAVNSIIPQQASRYPHASFFFPMPSFLSGVARTFDFMGTFNEYQSLDSDEFDAAVIARDWIAVGEDIEAAMESVRRPRRSRDD